MSFEKGSCLEMGEGFEERAFEASQFEKNPQFLFGDGPFPFLLFGSGWTEGSSFWERLF